MVKIRLDRKGAKARPFYRVVVTKSSAGRGGAFIENLGTYDPVAKPTRVKVNEERALYWLLQGAQPTETTAILLSQTGVLDQFFAQRPKARASFKFLDKRVSVTSAPTAASATAAESAPTSENA